MPLSATTTTTTEAVPPVSPDRVYIFPDADAVGQALCEIVQTSAVQAIATRGSFCLAIPGGSILKMLVPTATADDRSWTQYTSLAYVNHKCVDMTDINLSTHAKAHKLFLHAWDDNCHVILLNGTVDGPAEAAAYQAQLEQLVLSGKLPVDATTGLPQFDLALIGVGDDGHIGSLYPHRPEVTMDTSAWVMSVDMKAPPSITLSLPVMAAARQVVIAACGVSDKYPQGKSDGMRRAIADPSETIASFPAVGLRSVATWYLDTAAASKLGDAYSMSSTSSSE
jgi:6-phosphogluconolactonase